MNRPLRCVVLGAAGRDFHDVQTFFKSHPDWHVVAITAAQIPFIDRRTFPRELAGPAYADDIPIRLESELPALVREHAIDLVVLSYSDLSHAEVMHKASLALSLGAGFALLPPRETTLKSRKPVVSVTAVRTGAGKSPLTQHIARALVSRGLRVGVLRHPMPYGDLRKQRVERFATEADLVRYECTLEEREEYEPYVEMGLAIFAGVDYAAILEAAEKECDVVLWDGGNNDLPFVRPDLWITVVDALRPGHEVNYHPGETNLRAADVVVINKVDDATPEALATVRSNVHAFAPHARVVESALIVSADPPDGVEGKRALVIEDGPTVTHGSMSYGAGTLAAKAHNAREIIDPRPFAVGSIAQAYKTYPQMGAVLPALGYSPEQREELAETIRRCAPEVVVDGSPARVARVLGLDVPVVRARYRFEQRAGDDLLSMVFDALPKGGPR